MKTRSSFLILFVILALFACRSFGKRVNGNGNITTEDRQVGKAGKISVYGSMDVILTQGEPAVKVEADENIIPYVITDMEGGRLRIKLRENMNIRTQNKIRVYVSTPSLTQLDVRGSGNITSTNQLALDGKLSIAIAGSGDVTVDVNVPKVDADIAGSGNLHISGETRDVKVDIAGSGNFDGAELKSENAKINIAGSGDALVFADVELAANIMGSGKIKYRGNAAIERKVLGSGSISKLPL